MVLYLLSKGLEHEEEGEEGKEDKKDEEEDEEEEGDDEEEENDEGEEAGYEPLLLDAKLAELGLQEGAEVVVIVDSDGTEDSEYRGAAPPRTAAGGGGRAAGIAGPHRLGRSAREKRAIRAAVRREKAEVRARRSARRPAHSR
jgi:hypothetical protein